MPSKRKQPRKFDGIADGHQLDKLLGAKRAKRSKKLGLSPLEPHRRYKKWTESDVLWILEMLEKLPKGYQATFLKRIGTTSAQVWYWRKRFIERQKVIEPVVEEPPVEKPSTEHAKDHEFGIPDSFRRELDEEYDK